MTWYVIAAAVFVLAVIVAVLLGRLIERSVQCEPYRETLTTPPPRDYE